MYIYKVEIASALRFIATVRMNRLLSRPSDRGKCVKIVQGILKGPIWYGVSSYAIMVSLTAALKASCIYSDSGEQVSTSSIVQALQDINLEKERLLCNFSVLKEYLIATLEVVKDDTASDILRFDH